VLPLGMLVGDSPTGEFLFTGEFTGGFTATPGEFTGHYSKFILDKMNFMIQKLRFLTGKDYFYSKF
jgi:hypothetical protein